MKHTLIFYIAPKIENTLFRHLENDENKIFCLKTKITYKPSKPITEEYIREGMKKAKESYLNNKTESWIAAVAYMDSFFKEDENTIIFSDNISENYETRND